MPANQANLAADRVRFDLGHRHVAGLRCKMNVATSEFVAVLHGFAVAAGGAHLFDRMKQMPRL
jgi:hypothetical protein